MKFQRILLTLATTLLLALLLVACGDETPTPVVATIIPTSLTNPNTSPATASPAPSSGAATFTSGRTAVAISQPASNGVTELNFYFPAVTDGPIPQTFKKYTEEFTKANPDVKVNVVLVGSYTDVLKKVQTEIKAGEDSADVAIMSASDLYTLTDNDLIVPFDDLVAHAKGGDAYIKDFYPAFMLNSQANGKTWGIPFQRSTPVLYYNKDAFKEVGLDPDKAPATFKEMAAAAQKLTKPDGSRYGIKIPTDGFSYWLLQSLAISNGENVVSDAANQVMFNTPATQQGLTDFQSLVTSYKAMPKGMISWEDIPGDFINGYAAMVYHTSSSLTNIVAKAPFNVGVSFLPAGTKGFGTTTGGGNLYLIKNKAAQKQQAAFRLVQFLTDSARLADWMQVAGYVAPRKAAWDIDTLKLLVYNHPQYAVSRDQLQYAQKELATHASVAVQQILNKAVQAVISGEKDPTKALADAQAEADKLLAAYKN